MAGIRTLTSTWNTVTELDLRPYREAAERGVKLAVVGKPGSGRHALAEKMRRDPYRPQEEYPAPVLVADLEGGSRLPEIDLVTLMLNLEDPDDNQERLLVRSWLDAGRRILVVINAAGNTAVAGKTGLAVAPWRDWGSRNVLVGDSSDQDFLLKDFVPAVMRLLPDRHLALGRYYPLFRTPIVRYMINDACFSNAAYSLSTGLVEFLPLLNIPMNVTDIFVLTKNQLFLVYKLGLTLGMSLDIQTYIGAFGGVLGGGFFWRQAARMLVGLIPAWGILPKVAVAYAGTYAVGTTVLQWYLTGGKVTKGQFRQLYAQAFAKGRQIAPKLALRPKLLGSGRKKKGLDAPTPIQYQACPRCAKPNSPDARYCQYCGKPLPDQASV